MENTVGQTKRKNKSGRVGSFFLGIFIGLLLTLLALGGIGAFAYFKISPAWINKHFHAGIDLPIDENLTLSQIVSKATGLINNFSTYTINDLYKDFGLEINDSQFGINISSLKDEYFGDLGNAIANRAKNISLYELRNLDLVKSLPENFTNIIEAETSYYISGNTLYKNSDHSQEVSKENDFNYEIVTESGAPSLYIVNLERFKVESVSPDGGNYVAKIKGTNLPLKVAVQGIADSISGDITVGELRDNYKISLPDYIDDSVMVKNIGDAIQEIEIGRILNYQWDESENVYKKDGVALKGIMAKIATTTVGNLSADTINGFTIADIFPDSYTQDGQKSAINLIPAETTLTEIPKALEDAMKSATISTLVDNKIINEPEGYSGIANKWIDVNLAKVDQEGYEANYKQVKDLTISEIMDVYIGIINKFNVLQENKPST